MIQNTNYSWLKGTKCFKLNINLARIQPAKAGNPWVGEVCVCVWWGVVVVASASST